LPGHAERLEAALRLRFEVFNLELHEGSRNPFSPAWAKMNSIAFDGALNDVLQFTNIASSGPAKRQAVVENKNDGIGFVH